MFDWFLFSPPKSSYNEQSYPGEICNIDGTICLVLESRQACSHVLIYCHGNATDIGRVRDNLTFLRDALEMHIIAVEYPGYGLSEGNPNTDAVNDCLKSVYDFLHFKLNWPKKSIIFFGRSIGTGPAVELACEKEIGALILVSPFTSIRAAAQRMVGNVASLLEDRWKSEENIAKVSCPVLFLHGTCDKIFPAQHSLDLFDACPENKKYIRLLEDTGHNSMEWPIIVQQIHRFFAAKHISGKKAKRKAVLGIPRECFDRSKLTKKASPFWSFRPGFFNFSRSISNSSS